MPLNHESEVLREVERKADNQEAMSALAAAKPLFDYYAKQRNRMQAEGRKRGTAVTFGILHRGGEFWEISVPWNWEPPEGDDPYGLGEDFGDCEPEASNFFYRAWCYLTRKKEDGE